MLTQQQLSEAVQTHVCTKKRLIDFIGDDGKPAKACLRWRMLYVTNAVEVGNSGHHRFTWRLGRPEEYTHSTLAQNVTLVWRDGRPVVDTQLEEKYKPASKHKLTCTELFHWLRVRVGRDRANDIINELGLVR